MSERCCGCIPRRIGMLVWGYINAILSILWISASVGQFITILNHTTIPVTTLGIGVFFISPILTIAIMLLLIFEVHKIVTMAAFVVLVIYMMVTAFAMASHALATNLLKQLLFSVKGFWFTILLIIGCHLKCRRLTSLYYCSGLISCVESACSVVASIIGCIVVGIKMSSSWTTSEILSTFLPIYLSTFFAFIINVLLQAYILFLLRKEIDKYKLDERKYVTPSAPSAEDMPLNDLQSEGRNMAPNNLEALKPVYPP